MILKTLLVSLFLVSTLSAKAEDVLAQTKFYIRNGNKEFGVQHISKKKLYLIHFGLIWTNFNQQIHSYGYKLSGSTGIQFISPTMPAGCFLSDPLTVNMPIIGFLNGVDAGSNLLQIAIKGSTCDQFVAELGRSNFVAIFKNVPAQQIGAPSTPNLRLEVIELP
jgi:hypothetical protein